MWPSAKGQGLTRVFVVLFHLSHFFFKRNLSEKKFFDLPKLKNYLPNFTRQTSIKLNASKIYLLIHRHGQIGGVGARKQGST